MHMMHDLYLSLRRLQRASEIHAKRLGRHSGLTPIQLLILHSIKAMGEGTLGELARQVSVSQATLSTIIDRLENRELLHRIRSQRDKRKVHLALTDKVLAAIQAEPALLPSEFLDRFGQLARRAQENMLFRSDKETAGMCLNCGHVHYGTQVPPICPVCKHAQGYFVRVEGSEILVPKGLGGH